MSHSSVYDGGEDDYVTPDSVLLSLVQSYDWVETIARIKSHPDECKAVGVEGRTPLHVACDHDAPAMVVEALLKAYPEASLMVGTSNMNPLHITCSSQHANIEVVNTLLQGGHSSQTSMRDIDGDTPLHAACRCGAPIDVLRVLLEANVDVVNTRDYEGLTPLLRLWVRYFVILGDDTIERVTGEADLTSNAELGEAWKKTELLLRCAHLGSLDGPADLSKGSHNLPLNYKFRIVHAAAAVDCPRPVVKIATILHPEQLTKRDENGMTPLLIAARAPIYEVHDLTDNGYELEDQILGDEDDDDDNEEENDEGSQEDDDEEEEGSESPGDDDRVDFGRSNDDVDESENDDVDNNAAVLHARQGGRESSEQARNTSTSSSSTGVINSHPSVIEILVQAGPKTAKIPSKPGNLLPLHYAVASGKKWNQGVKTILDVYPEAVSRIDTSTGLFPFLQAASIGKPDCSTILELLLADPSLMDQQERDTIHAKTKAKFAFHNHINKKRRLNTYSSIDTVDDDDDDVKSLTSRGSNVSLMSLDDDVIVVPPAPSSQASA